MFILSKVFISEVLLVNAFCIFSLKLMGYILRLPMANIPITIIQRAREYAPMRAQVIYVSMYVAHTDMDPARIITSKRHHPP